MNVVKLLRSSNQCPVSYRKFLPVLINTREIKTNAQSRDNLKTVLRDAESIIGYPTSFLSLRWLLNDEFANIALYVRKLIGINHPLLKTMKDILMGHGQPSWGLILLLMSKTAGLNSTFSEIEHDHTAGILHSQRVLAEMTEMIRTGNLIHKQLLNLSKNVEFFSELSYGNNLALLNGDYLLSKSYIELSALRNQPLLEIMASALRDLTEADFVGLRDLQNNPIPSEPSTKSEAVVEYVEPNIDPVQIRGILGSSKPEWILRNLLSGATLLGKSCQCSLLLGEHPRDLQELAYMFGRNLALAWQAAIEYRQVKNDETFSLVSAPVLFHLEYDPEYYKEFHNLKDISKDVDFSKVRKTISNGPGLERTLELKEEFSSQALQFLGNFKESEAKNALVNIVKQL